MQHALNLDLVGQGGRQKSKVKSQNEYSVRVLLIWNGGLFTPRCTSCLMRSP
ncbi:hypothetical protein LC608_05365 [Nostoc sp. XA010]|uniref:hypothetical protein n=1 Tax=Nostoc sp. XA010 TaxID=2780407 RepID=UPI001E403A45|nr:hypothetical protein [Nostoc sp. XA010]MCC5656420.1 hypothetical protein [Nostoc sp. XA010]